MGEYFSGFGEVELEELSMNNKTTKRYGFHFVTFKEETIIK